MHRLAKYWVSLLDDIISVACLVLRGHKRSPCQTTKMHSTGARPMNNNALFFEPHYCDVSYDVKDF